MGRLMQARPRIGAAPSLVQAAPKVAMSFYSSPEWRGLVADIIKMRGRQCEDCGTKRGRILGDHTVELKDGGAALDPSNVRLMCAPCHGRKTARAQAARVGRS